MSTLANTKRASKRKPPDWRFKYDVSVSEYCAPWGGGRHLRIRRRDGKDGISWDVLQRIKDDLLGPEATAIEVYPLARELVYDVNMRHLWEVPEGCAPSLY